MTTKGAKGEGGGNTQRATGRGSRWMEGTLASDLVKGKPGEKKDAEAGHEPQRGQSGFAMLSGA